MLATTLPSSRASSEGLAAPDAFEELDRLKNLVYDVNACALPGVDIKLKRAFAQAPHSINTSPTNVTNLPMFLRIETMVWGSSPNGLLCMKCP